MNESTETQIKHILGVAGKAYYFSDELVSSYERGDVAFTTKAGSSLKPEYFGSGLSGKNGILRKA